MATTKANRYTAIAIAIVTTACLVLSVWSQRVAVRAQQRTIAAVNNSGGSAYYSYFHGNGHLTDAECEASQPVFKRAISSLFGRDAAYRIAYVTYFGREKNAPSEVVDDAVQSIARLGEIDTLDLRGSTATIRGIEALNHTRIQQLRIDNCPMLDNRAVGALNPQRIHHLALSQDQVTKQDIRRLQAANPDLKIFVSGEKQ